MNEVVAVIDYGSGNLRSAAKALERAATDPRVRVVRLGGSGRGFAEITRTS